MRVYIAGPYQHPGPVENTRKAILAAERLIAAGHTPYIPHLTLFWHLVAPHEVAFWYAHDIEWLRVCDALVRLPGESKGADEEVRIARDMGMPIYTEGVPHNLDNNDLAELLNGFEGFVLRCRQRLRMGSRQYGDDWKTKDNLAEAKAEALDFFNYGFLAWMQDQE